MTQNLKGLLERGKRRSKLAVATGSAFIAGVAPQIMAHAEGVSADKLVGNVINVITSIFFYIGILLLCWGAGMLLLAFKNEDADSKSRAIMLIIVSVALIGIKGFLNTILEGTGFSVGEE